MESGGGGGVESIRKEKGERMKVTPPSLRTPTISLFFPAHFTWPVGSWSVHTSKKGGKKVVLAQLFSLRSPYYLTA